MENVLEQANLIPSFFQPPFLLPPTQAAFALYSTNDPLFLEKSTCFQIPTPLHMLVSPQRSLSFFINADLLL